MTVLTKTRVPFEVKASDDAGHTFSGLAAAWSQDLGNDVIHKGAFARTLDHWRAQQKRRPIPLCDQHDYSSVTTVVGKMTDAEETDAGLLSTFGMVPDDDLAERAFRRVKGGFVTGLSIGYEAVRWEYEQQKDAPPIRHLHEVKLMEVSLVIWGMNEDALTDPDSAKQMADNIRALIRKGRFTEQEKQELRALLDATPAGRHEPPPAPEPKGLAPDRLDALRQRLLALKLHRLATQRAALGADPARVG